MSKFTISHGQNTVPMNLFATWEVDRSSPHCIPRVCSLALRKLIVIKELDKDLQSIFLAVKMQGSKRVLRSNEIGLPANGLLTMDLELTFSLQYPHFIKRDGNILQVMLQRRKRYKNRAMLGYKTLAIGTVDMAQIIQSPIVEESVLDLMSTNKDRRNSVVVSAQVVMSSVYSTPTDEVEVGIGRSGKQTEADRSPDVDNYTDDEETFSSDPEMGSDVNPREYIDDEENHKRKERRKVRMSSSSRQQNFIKAKLVALLRRFKQVEDEGLEQEMGQDPDVVVPGPDDLDFLYDEIEDLNFSDSCPEVEDNISIVSTPKPKLRPFFDRTSHSSSQTEVCSLRDQPSGEHIHYGQDSRENSLGRRNREVKETFESLRNSDKTPAIDQSDSSEEDDQNVIIQQAANFSHPDSFRQFNLLDDEVARFGSEPGSPCHSQNPPTSINNQTKRRKRSWPRSRSPSFQMTEGKYTETASSAEELDLSLPQQQTSLHVINGSFTAEDDDITHSCTLPSPLLLVNRSDRNGKNFAEALQSYIAAGNTAETVILATSSQDQLSSVFNVLISKLQKFINSNSQQPMRVKVGIAGTESYVNLVLRQFVEFLSSRSPDWITYFLFFVIPLGKNQIGQYLCSLDSHYAKLFNDQLWRETFDKGPASTKAHTPNSISMEHHTASFENQQNTEKTCVRRALEYIDEASATLSLSVAEAMLTFGQKSENEDTSQKFVPFVSGAKVGENEFLMQHDSDKEDIVSGPTLASTSANTTASPAAQATASTGGATAMPTSPAINNTSNSQHASIAGSTDSKMGLQVDYWKDRDSTKYTLKTTFKSFHVSKLPTMGEHIASPGLELDVVTIGKKNIMRLPGKKGKEKEAESKSLIISNINRIICTSKHQHNLLKVKIDGIEWKEVKFFQLSSHWSSHVKTFPVGLFSAH
ncbi:phosphofurin acidic cluster sorting protein 2-like [Styela clava]